MRLDAKKYCNLAEREGFEPSVPVTQDARLAIRPSRSRRGNPWGKSRLNASFWLVFAKRQVSLRNLDSLPKKQS